MDLISTILPTPPPSQSRWRATRIPQGGCVSLEFEAAILPHQLVGVCGRARAGKTAAAHAIARALTEEGVALPPCPARPLGRTGCGPRADLPGRGPRPRRPNP